MTFDSLNFTFYSCLHTVGGRGCYHGNMGNQRQWSVQVVRREKNDAKEDI
jgi:hypothetical protein